MNIRRHYKIRMETPSVLSLIPCQEAANMDIISGNKNTLLILVIYPKSPSISDDQTVVVANSKDSDATNSVVIQTFANVPKEV